MDLTFYCRFWGCHLSERGSSRIAAGGGGSLPRLAKTRAVKVKSSGRSAKAARFVCVAGRVRRWSIEVRRLRRETARHRGRGCASFIRPSTTCGTGRGGGCRASVSISSMAAPPRNTASSAIPPPSRRSSCLPHYCIDGKVTTEIELFGRRYSADRRRPDGLGRPDVAGGGETVRRRGAAASTSPTCWRRPAMPRSRRSPRSRRTCSGSSSTASPTTTTPSPTISCAAPTRPARTCWCRPSTRAGKSKRPRDIRNGCRGAVPDQSVDDLSGADLAGLDACSCCATACRSPPTSCPMPRRRTRTRPPK